MPARIKITQIRSLIGREQSQRVTVRSLGLRRIGHSVEKLATAPVLGMVRKVTHLVEVEVVEDADA